MNGNLLLLLNVALAFYLVRAIWTLGPRSRLVSILEAHRSERLPHHSISALAQTAVLGLRSTWPSSRWTNRFDLVSSEPVPIPANLGKLGMPACIPHTDGDLVGPLASEAEPICAWPGQCRHSPEDTGRMYLLLLTRHIHPIDGYESPIPSCPLHSYLYPAP